MKWFIPGNVPSSKNGRRWTGKYFIASKATVNYRKATREIYRKLRKSFRKEFDKYELPVKVTFEFHRGTRHKFVQINPAQTIQDEMVVHKWIDDDNADTITPAFDPYNYNKEKPGVTIKINANDNTKKTNTKRASDSNEAKGSRLS
ncbi:MAG: hypothetical protein CMH79_05285 [Nitrospinae bacterium]|nr:hypothetical protein [Nitrospinota bacterium]